MDKETSEITKLTERISKDPKSKLFVPLAEEYKKAGDMEMAVHVLTEGLRNNPSYVTARSFLGKLLIEQGNLADARQEFEEVIKAIPDNLMAQRKLGDLCVLQNQPAEALKHYKAVLTINPKDNETAILVAEAEAGRDIRNRVPGPKVSAPAAAEPEVKQEPVPPRSAPGKNASSSPLVAPPAAAVPAAPEPASEEEAEEVLIVEPLLPEESVATVMQESSSGGFAFLAESEPPASAETEATGAGEPFALSEQAGDTGTTTPFAPAETALFEEATSTLDTFAPSEEPAGVFSEAAPSLDLGDPFAEVGPADPAELPSIESPGPFSLADDIAAPEEGRFSGLNLEEPFAVAEEFGASEEEPIDAVIMDEPLASEKSADVQQGETLFAEQAPATDENILLGEELPADEEGSDILTAEVIEETEKQADDFTTDTLAELYISQGFFEKAIDIYERMLADHPNSAGLKDKLTHVRAMAAAAEQEPGAASISASEEPDDGEEPRRDSAAGPDVFVPPPAGFAQPRLDDWEVPSTKAIPISTDGASSPCPSRQPKPFDMGFEPREYVPPDAVPRRSELAERNAPAGHSPAAEEQLPEDRKETVERLESWLKNIMKET